MRKSSEAAGFWKTFREMVTIVGIVSLGMVFLAEWVSGFRFLVFPTVPQRLAGHLNRIVCVVSVAFALVLGLSLRIFGEEREKIGK